MEYSRFLLAAGCAALLVMTLSGCGDGDRIERYTVRKPTPPESRAAGTSDARQRPRGEPTDRTLAAIVPHADQGWFFKLTGPKDPVAAQSEAFGALLKSVRFSSEGKPEWTLPEGWQQRGGSDIRYATLVIPSDDKPLEVSVTALPKPPGDDETYALVNINRWRGQLGLPPIARDQLASESTAIELDGAKATLVDLVGTATAGAMGRPPFFPGAGNGK
jgi:hypothetical protein